MIVILRVITIMALMFGGSWGDSSPTTSAISAATTTAITPVPHHNNYVTLIEKYSDSEKFLTVHQLQTLLDKIYTRVSVNGTAANDKPDVDSECAQTKGECVDIIHKGCLTAQELFKQLNIEDGKFDISSFEAACPVILSHVEESSNCEYTSSDGKKSKEEASGKPRNMEVWGLGLLFVTIISLCSLIGVSVLPLMKKKFYKQLLTVLIGLAVGSLSSSSLFHLIPQSFNLMEHDTHHNYLNVSLMMWFGIWCFFMTERLLRVFSDARKRKEEANAKSSVSSPTELTPEQEMLQQPVEDSNGCANANPEVIYDYQKQAIKASFGHTEKPHNNKHSHNQDLKKFKPGKDSAIATVAWMVIFGDGLHNFIDGLSIGAAFSESILTGVSISLAVLCEEFPHELGDFAVLLNAGMSMKQALIYNFLSACTCYIGLVVGILLGEIECSNAIFGFAAGMFLYISLVDMVPEMNEVAEEASQVSVKLACWTLFLQNIGIGLGVVLLYTLARYQDSIGFS